MKAYRIENLNEKRGIWRTFEGKYNPVFPLLSDGKQKDNPMDDSEFYRADGKRWFSATDSSCKLKEWFSAMDALELQNLGYSIYEFEIKDCKIVSSFEIVFTRDSILSYRELNPADIYGEEFLKLKLREIVISLVDETLECCENYSDCEDCAYVSYYYGTCSAAMFADKLYYKLCNDFKKGGVENA